MNQRYARGSRAWGLCARSGRRLLLKDMVEDPRTGLLVDPEWAEMPDPRPPENITDGISLERPAPNTDQIGVLAYPSQVFDLATGEPMRPLCSKYEMGRVRGTAA